MRIEEKRKRIEEGRHRGEGRGGGKGKRSREIEKWRKKRGEEIEEGGIISEVK